MGALRRPYKRRFRPTGCPSEPAQLLRTRPFSAPCYTQCPGGIIQKADSHDHEHYPKPVALIEQFFYPARLGSNAALRSVAQAGRTRVNTLVNIKRRRESPRPYVHLQPEARHLFQQIANTFRFNPKDRIPFVAIKSSIVLVGQSFKRFLSYDVLMASLSYSSQNYFLTSQILPMSFLQQSFLC